MDRAEGSVSSDSSDLDDDLNAPEFLKIFSKRSSADSGLPSESTKCDPSPKKESRLDDLLSEHVHETAERTRLEKVKAELLQDLESNSQEEPNLHSQSLASEHEDHLQQLDVKTSEPLVQPGIKLFHKEGFGCLYSEETSPFACGFTSTGSAIDKMVARTVPDTLTDLLLSKAIVACVNQLSDVDSVLIWLLNILAIHPSPVTAHSSYINIIGILHQFKITSMSKKSATHLSWYPHPLALLRIFVNLGADSQELLGRHHRYTQDEIDKFLVVENDENEGNQEHPKGHLVKENIKMVYKVIANALQTQPDICAEDLNQMFFMLAKVELDVHVNRSMNLEALECFSAIIQCYRDVDWPAVVPGLCRRLLEVSEHHHNRFHLADLLPATTRGSCLQVRLAYLCLRSLLLPDGKDVDDGEILDYKLADVPSFCRTRERPAVSPLAQALRSLLERDMYRMISAIKFLDLCVGDDLYRSSQPWQSLEYLISQANLVIKTIKDDISAMDLSKIKDSLSKLKVKWSLSLQDQQSKQRKIVPWLSTAGREVVRQEILSDQGSLLDDLDMDI